MSLFGGGTDYKSFYSQNGSFLIGSTINKYSYLFARERPSLLPKQNSFSYSKLEFVDKVDDFENPLIRETLKYCQVGCCLDFHHLSDIPHRTGLGGSSSFSVGLLYLIKKARGEKINRIKLAQEAIFIEREILKEAGGIQDQIWAAASEGLSSIEIFKDGQFAVKPLPVTQDFKKAFEESFALIYTNDQRQDDSPAKSYDGKEKSNIHKIALEAYDLFLKENIKGIGNLLYQSWLAKKTISNHISSSKIDDIAQDVMNMGAFGLKLIGSGGSGFIAVMADPLIKNKIIDKYRDSILDIKFENGGVREIYNNN